MPFFLTSKFGSGAYGVNAIRDARNKPGVKKASRMFARLTYLFDQNLLLRKKTRPLFAFIAFLIFGFELGVGLNCQAGTPFDDYTIGNINGQDSWSETSPTGYINVVGNPVNSGSQAVESSVTAPGENILSRSVTDSTTGSFSIYIRHDGGRDYLNFKDDGNYAIYTKYESTSFSFYNGSWNVACTGLTNNQYWNIQIEWRSSDHKARYKCGIAAWTDWYTSYAAWSDGIDELILTGSPNSGTTNVYYDDFTMTGYSPPVLNSIEITDPDTGDRSAPLTAYETQYQVASTTEAFHIKIITGTQESVVENATSGTTGVFQFDTLVGLNSATGTVPIGNNKTYQIDTQYYSKAILYYMPDPGNPFTEELIAESDVIDWQISSYIGIGDATTSLDYYDEHVPAFFASSTPSIIYTSLTDVFNMIFTPVFWILEKFGNLYDLTQAYNNGVEMGNSIATLFKYADQVNQIFNFPFIPITIFLIILEITLIIWKQAKRATGGS